MNRSPSKQTVLTVRAADNLTEVFLADSRFELIASGIGRVEATVAPGLYKARFRVGQIQTDSLIEVEAGARSKVFDGPAVQFASPAPLVQTLTYQQAQAEAAQKLSPLQARSLYKRKRQPTLSCSQRPDRGRLPSVAGSLAA